MGLLLMPVLPATQALCLGVDLMHGHVHPHDERDATEVHLHAADPHAEHHHHLDESVVETLLHGHEHDQSTPDHRHDVTSRNGAAGKLQQAPALGFRTGAIAPISLSPKPSPTSGPAPVASAAPPLRYSLCSLLI